MSIIDSLVESQRIVNQEESNICDIMSIPGGARLLQWAYTVRSTWWYKLFSRIDPRLNGRTADNTIEDKVNEIISEVNNIEAKLLSASPTNTGRQFVAQMPPTCPECPVRIPKMCFMPESEACLARLWRHFCRT